MIDGLRPYAEMKPSGLPWLGDVPAHWEVLPLKRIARFKSGAGFPVAYQGGSGHEIPFLKVSDMTLPGNERWTVRYRNTVSRETALELGAHVFPENTIIFPKVGGAMLTNKRRILRQDSCIDNNVMGCTVTKSDVFFSFIFALFQNIDLGKICKPGPVPAIGESEVGELRVGLPPLDEQRLIVRFLDWHGAQTAKLTAKKKKIIALLNEQKQAIIHRAVTRGLDPNVRLKPSGIPWLGDVPEEWEVKRLKSICRFIYGDSLPSEMRLPGHVHVFGSNGSVGTHTLANTNAPCIVIGRKGSFGKVNWSDQPVFAIDTTYFVDTRSSDQPLRWLYHMLVWLRLDDVSKDSAVPGLDREDAYQRRIAVPTDPAEQQAIAEFIDLECRQLNDGIDAVQREIALIQEFRTRLIADVVTGKLDVRAIAAGLPETVELEPIDDLVEGDDPDEAVDDTENEEVAA